MTTRLWDELPKVRHWMNDCCRCSTMKRPWASVAWLPPIHWELLVFAPSWSPNLAWQLHEFPLCACDRFSDTPSFTITWNLIKSIWQFVLLQSGSFQMLYRGHCCVSYCKLLLLPNNLTPGTWKLGDLIPNQTCIFAVEFGIQQDVKNGYFGNQRSPVKEW